MKPLIRLMLTFGVGVLLALVCLSVALGQPMPDEDRQVQPRILGNMAVMHVYYYAPKTLEVTYVDNYLFKDGETCKAAVPKALLISIAHASEGDLVRAVCAVMEPPPAITGKPLPKGSTEL